MKFQTEKHLKDFEKDKFGYFTLSKNILDNVLLEMELPNCFGLYGNWGSGKSTMLHYLIKHIEDDVEKKYQRISTVYFETWKYEYTDEKSLLFALLKNIQNQCGLSDKKIWKKLLIDLSVITAGVARKFPVTSNIIETGKAATEDFNFLEKKMYSEYEIWIDKIEGFKKEFENIIKKALKKSDSEKLVIFIDDLDRCLPENSVKLLEAIKNFLSVDNTLFVLAIDRRIISEMIDKKYGLHYAYGDEYLSKIIHYYFELPTVNLKGVINDILSVHSINYTEEQEKYFLNFLKNQAKEPRRAKQILHQFGMVISLSKELQREISEDQTNLNLEYIFVASFLLNKFPHIFLNDEPTILLRRLLDYAVASTNNAHSSYEQELNKAINALGSFNAVDRDKIKSILVQHPIRTGREASAPRYIENMVKLGKYIDYIRLHL